jgi:hypothetical protein
MQNCPTVIPVLKSITAADPYYYLKSTLLFKDIYNSPFRAAHYEAEAKMKQQAMLEKKPL